MDINKRYWLALFFLQVFFSQHSIAQIDFDVYKNYSLGPIGGGQGYSGRVVYSDEFTLVYTLEDLTAALNDHSIKKIFISGGAEIVTTETIVINTDGLLLASDRGLLSNSGELSPGALLRLNSGVESLIEVNANNVHITGLRIADSNYETYLDATKAGIYLKADSSSSMKTLEVDNCELFNWIYAGVRIVGILGEGSQVSASIHHNHIHSSKGQSTGYGTIVDNNFVNAFLLYNLYQDNRHSVAASGEANQKYTAAYNLTLQPTEQRHETGTEYDMHGYSDLYKGSCGMLALCNPYSSCNIAGEEVILLGNAIIGQRRLASPRGIVTTGMFAINNHSSVQNNFKLWLNNHCELPPPRSEDIILDSSEWEKYHFFERHNDQPSNSHAYYQQVSWSGKSVMTPLFFNTYRQGNIALVDFDGDGIDDIFYADGESWKVSWRGVTPWENISSYVYQHQLAFGDFNGDGKTDVFRGDGKHWSVSWGGITQWEVIADSAYRPSQLAFGDFDGNGITDVFHGDGKNWMVSWGGRKKWEIIADSAYKTDQLAFGDFNGDGITDVFEGDGKNWRVSWGGRKSWEVTADSVYRTNQLSFGDFDGNGETDVFLGDGGHWRVSLGARGAWITINDSRITNEYLKFGDFNGDGITDVFFETKILN